MLNHGLCIICVEHFFNCDLKFIFDVLSTRHLKKKLSNHNVVCFNETHVLIFILVWDLPKFMDPYPKYV